MDRTVGIANASGLSLCLRLLALIDLLARAPWARSLFHLARDGAEFHPALLRAAASQPLTREARQHANTSVILRAFEAFMSAMHAVFTMRRT